MVNNKTFIKAIFGPDHPWCHVTDFLYDPTAIPKNKHLIAWKGDYYCRYNLKNNSNQYFTISTFYCDDQGQARRRKALFRQTHCIVLDDVKEKLSLEQVRKLPEPSWVLETSPGSEQWGYILNTPCTDRNRVENLLDGLVTNGLAPGGKDPGMKGVTRYVRLPEGVNSKASKLVNGQPRQCVMLSWQPFNTVTMEQLAEPFAVNLDALRREQRLDGASSISDHPLINIPDIIQIKEIRSDGRFDIRCPWVDEHTGADDSGAAVFTNEDGTIGFKCHHGACQHRTGKHLINFIDSKVSNWSTDVLKNWQIMRSFQEVAPVDFMGEKITTVKSETRPAGPEPIENIQLLCDELNKMIPNSKEARGFSSNVLKHVDDLPKIDQKHWHNIVCDIMRWNKSDFKEILKDLRQQWYNEKIVDNDLFQRFVFVRELNKFYEFPTRIFYSKEAFQNSFCNENPDVINNALQDGMVKQVHKLDYAPKSPVTFTQGQMVYGNMWSDHDQPKGVPGDVSPWLNHFDVLGWSDNREHIEQWMAYTLRHPDVKINHMLLLGSGEGCGKDFLLMPLMRGMGENGSVISGNTLISDFEDYLLSTKYLHINETDLADHRAATQISEKLKPIAASPPEQLSVNPKGVTRIKIRNVVNGTMTTNSQLPLRLNGPSRRFYAVWSDLNTRDKSGQMTKEWVKYWNEMWQWMNGDGWKYVLYYLLNTVSLEGFNPGTAPVVTEFLSDMQEGSKSPLQQTIEIFIDEKIGLFKSDILTAKDITDVLKSSEVFDSNIIYCDVTKINPVWVGRTLVSVPDVFSRRVNIKGSSKTITLWVIRNQERYLNMNPIELRRLYDLQITNCRGGKPDLKILPTIKKEGVQ